MTYERLYELKFRQGFSTYELMKRYPKHIKRVSEVALLDIPEDTLREIIREEKTLCRLIKLKRRLSESAIAQGA